MSGDGTKRRRLPGFPRRPEDTPDELGERSERSSRRTDSTIEIRRIDPVHDSMTEAIVLTDPDTPTDPRPHTVAGEAAPDAVGPEVVAPNDLAPEVAAPDEARTAATPVTRRDAASPQASSPVDATQAHDRFSLPRVTPREPAEPQPPRDEAQTHTALRLPRPQRPAVRLPGAGAPAGPTPWAASAPPIAAPPSDPRFSGGADRSVAPGAAHPLDPDTTTNTDDDADAADDKKSRGWSGALREIAVVVSIALVLSFLVKTFLAQPFWIPSGSMNNTLVQGDRIVVSKLTPGVFDLKRGDVIVFEDPDEWIGTPEQNRGPIQKGLEFVGLYPAGGNHLVKRVIGLPGDKVICCDAKGRLTVNGTAINEPYVFDGDAPSTEKFSITVPQGRVWVMGDHRSDSSDSRFHDDGSGATGSVPVEKITGRAVLIVWPLGRMGGLSDYSSTFDKVADP